MSKIRLSLCIPTYNFGQFIGATLESVVRQMQDNVEIVVLDGASTDNTGEVVRGFQKRCPSLTYHRLEKKGGIDNDLARTLDLARGEYCWLLSSDDVPVDGAIARMLAELASGDDIYLCDRIETDFELRPLRQAPWIEGQGDRTFGFAGPADFRTYFHFAGSIGALFSYISSIVVRRDQWIASAPDPKFIGTNYAHAARLFSILLDGGTLRYIQQPLVLCRGENDSFAQSGVVRRFLIDLDGYLLLSSLFKDKTVQSDFLAVMRREHPWYVYAELRSRIETRAKWKEFREKLLAFGYRPWQVMLVGIAGSVPLVMVLARMLWFGLRRVKRTLIRVLHKEQERQHKDKE